MRVGHHLKALDLAYGRLNLLGEIQCRGDFRTASNQGVLVLRRRMSNLLIELGQL